MAQKLDLTPINDDVKSKKLDLTPLDLEPIDNSVQDAKKFLDTTPNISDTTPVSSNTEEKGWLRKLWEKATTPLSDFPSRTATKIADFHAENALPDPYVNMGMRVGGQIADSMTSPLNIALTALTGGEYLAGKVGLNALASALNIAGKATSIPSAIEGGRDLFTGEGIVEKGSGLLELGMSTLPFLGRGRVKSKIPETKIETKPTVDINTGELFEPELTAPNPTAGTPSFGGKGKPTGIQQNTITVKAGDNLAEVQDVVAGGYKLSHQNPDGSYTFIKSPDAPVTETQVAKVSPTKANVNKLGPVTDKGKGSLVSDLLSLPRSIMASTDMSAPLRQGLPLIHKKEYWQAIPDLFKAFGSEKGYKAVQESIAAKPIFKPKLGPQGETLPSFADEAGLKLTDLFDLSNKEEALQSSLAEKIPGFGKLYRASERSYTAFLNKVRADTFETLVNTSNVLNPDGQNNLALARGLADFVNTATGRGSLGKLEKNAELLGRTFFAPRLIASRLKMLNPHYYLTADPVVRKEALKSLFAVAAFGNTLGQLSRLAGASVESDSTSSDFGKIRIGNTRIDPFGGFQQYIVAANRLVQGRIKSTTSGNEYNLGEKFGRPTRLDVAGRFVESKLNPLMTLAIDLLRGKDFTGQPVNVPEEVASRFIPIFIQDLKQLATENPHLIPNMGQYNEDSYDEFIPENLPFAVPAWFGMGVQNYPSRR